MRIESSKGAAAKHGRDSFRRSCACAACCGLVAGWGGCGIGTGFNSSDARNSSGSNFFLMALHKAHGHDLSHAAGGRERRGDAAGKE